MYFPPIIVYKTRDNYDNFVPINLSSDKTYVSSFPHPSDLRIDNNYCLPTKLLDNYLLDNRGINKNTVFINLTYNQYKLNYNPRFFLNNVIDFDPFIEMWECDGLDNNLETVSKLKEQIKSGEFFKLYRRIK